MQLPDLLMLGTGCKEFVGLMFCVGLIAAGVEFVRVGDYLTFLRFKFVEFDIACGVEVRFCVGGALGCIWDVMVKLQFSGSKSLDLRLRSHRFKSAKGSE